MSKNITIIDKEYKEWIKDLSMRYRHSQIKAAVKVNTEMLSFYWELGRDISKYDLDSKYGSRFYSVLSKDLQKELPNVSGLTERNIRYMKSFYLLYSQEKRILPQAVAEFKMRICHKLWQSQKMQLSTNLVEYFKCLGDIIV